MAKKKKRFAFQPDYVVGPGMTLSELLDEKGLRPTDLAQRSGISSKAISNIINSKASITNSIALKLENVLGLPASFWSKLESDYQETKIRNAEFDSLALKAEFLSSVPVNELAKRGFVEKLGDKTQLAQSVLAFFGVSSPDSFNDTWITSGVQFRGAKDAANKRPGYVAAWLRVGELEAQDIKCGPYSKSKFLECLGKIRRLTRENMQDAITEAKKLCAECGVALVVVKGIAGASVSGATRWLKGKAVIQLSLKYKSDDQFWFTFFHEAGHVVLHGKKSVFIEDGYSADTVEEQQANEFAANLLIPKQYLSQLPFLRSKNQIRSFANNLSIAPGIVVGRMQHDKYLSQSHCNDLKRKIQWSEDAS